MAGRLRTRTWCATLALIVALGVSGGMGAQQGADRFWAQWRGPFATGVSRTATPPVEWSETKNIRWKVPIAGRSSSTPVVWGDRIFLLTAVAADPATVAGLAPRGSVPCPQPPQIHRHGHRPEDRQDGLGTRGARRDAPRTPSGKWHVGFIVGRD
ncbi:MAG: hypothetical protein IPL75_13465 [Acidobacteria bacterium]|nr:hypothetical protein [Acidobacteriota bacterium]